MKVFITGSTGQVGNQLINYLISEKHCGIQKPADIICLVRSKKKALDLAKKGVCLIEGTLSDKAILRKAMQDSEMNCVFHLAANIDTSSDYRGFYIPNYIGTRNMLDAFIMSPAHTFCFTSSVAVYESFISKKQVSIVTEKTPLGTTKELKKGEGYSVTKRKCEALIQEYVLKYPQKRFFITRTGPIIGKKDLQVIPNFVKLLSTRFIPRMIAGGRDLFNITSPLDLARAHVFLAEHPSAKSGEVFNVCGENITYRGLYDIICEFYHLRKPKISIPMEFFRLISPTLPYARTLFPRNKFFQQAFSDSAIGYIGRTFIYKTDKIKALGFKFTQTPEMAIKDALQYISRLPEYSVYSMQPFFYYFAKKIVKDSARDLKEVFELIQIVRTEEIKNRQHTLSIIRRICFTILLLIVIITLLSSG